MTSKNCTKCGELKLLNYFGLKNGKPKSDCKKCNCLSAKNRVRDRKSKGLTSLIYSRQKRSSVQRFHPPPSYSMNGLDKWIKGQKNYNSLFDRWELSGFNKRMTPSVDRLNDYIPYEMDNIRLVTWGENHKKAMEDIKNGVNNKKSRPVIRTDKSGDELLFNSIAIASRESRAGIGNIWSCCKGKRKTCGGFSWRYALGLTRDKPK